MIRPETVPFSGEILRRSSFGRRPRLVLCAAMCALAARTAAAADPRMVTAVETRTPITLDGVLDDEAWISAEPATDFVQAEPHEGQAATERTTVKRVPERGVHDRAVVGRPDETRHDLRGVRSEQLATRQGQ
jgi:hypothetical protein